MKITPLKQIKISLKLCHLIGGIKKGILYLKIINSKPNLYLRYEYRSYFDMFTWYKFEYLSKYLSEYLSENVMIS